MYEHSARERERLRDLGVDERETLGHTQTKIQGTREKLKKGRKKSRRKSWLARLKKNNLDRK